MSKDNTIETMEEENDVILPEGWSDSENADIFDPSTWGEDDTGADAHEDDEAEGEGNSIEVEADQTRATEEDADTQNVADEDDQSPATTEDNASDGKLRFQANVDHVTREVELDPADLPDIYEKAQVLDRYKQRIANLEADLSRLDSIAAGLKYENRGALLDGLFEGAVQDFIAEHPSVPEEMARDYISRQFQTKPPAKEPEPEQKPGERDFKQEVADLFRAYPGARTERIPDEVTNDALAMNKPLVQAYADWKARTASAKATRAERENKILKQNQAAAAKAPVSKVTGGGKTDTKPVDDFLRGFEEDSAW